MRDQRRRYWERLLVHEEQNAGKIVILDVAKGTLVPVGTYAECEDIVSPDASNDLAILQCWKGAAGDSGRLLYSDVIDLATAQRWRVRGLLPQIITSTGQVIGERGNGGVPDVVVMELPDVH